MKCNAEVIICTDYVTKDPESIQKILQRVSLIVSNSHARRMKEGVKNDPW